MIRSYRFLFAAPFAGAALSAAIAGCTGGSSTSSPGSAGLPAVTRATSPYPTALPRLYVDHNGTLSMYKLPLQRGAKPFATLKEAPGSVLAPQIAVNPQGAIAIGTPQELRYFKPPISSFNPKAAVLRLPFNGSITAVASNGAELNDMQFDTVGNLWLVSNLAGEITELRKPLRKTSVAQLFVLFGVKGTKTSGFGSVLQARFDVNNTLYAYAGGAGGNQLFKLGFPYAGSPSPVGLNLSNIDVVDPSQYLPTNPNPAPMLLGQYIGPLHSPPPQQPPPPPVDQLSQFDVPLDPQTIFPAFTVNQQVGALIADPPRVLFYTLDVQTGALGVWRMPLGTKARPLFSLACIGGAARCNGKPEHLFLAP